MRRREAFQKAAWSLDESLVAQRMRNEGKTLQQIGNAVGRSIQSVAGHLSVVDQRAFKAAQAMRQKTPPQARRCQVCGKTFTPTQLGLIYCSRSCRTRSYTNFQHL